MAFHNDRLPVDVERGAQGGPRFKTTVLTLASGHEKRNADWSRTRGLWDIGYGLNSLDPSAADATVGVVQEHFYARQGRFSSFPFKDWADFEIGDPANPTADNQLIGLGDGTTTVFQVFKRYTGGAFTFDRPVSLLVSGTVSVLLDGVVQGGGFTIQNIGGTVTFSTAPAATGGTGPGGEVVVGIACEYDVPVRYDTDHLVINMQLYNLGSIPDIPLVEVRADEVS